MDQERTGNTLYLHQLWHKIPLSPEELQAQEAAAAPEKMNLGGEGGFLLGAAPKHRIEKEAALVVLPGRERVPLPCPDLPELVLGVVDAVMVGGACTHAYM
jgi:ubiquitin carboxyl-terminal hydrolase 5/13